MSNCEKLHKLHKISRLYYADYSLGKDIPFRVLEGMVGKWITVDEFDPILQLCTASFSRRWHSIFVWDDVGTRLIEKGQKDLAKKIFCFMESLCQSGADFAFLAIRVHKFWKDIAWCKKLFDLAKSNIKDENCYYNMLNFAKIGLIIGDEVEKLFIDALQHDAGYGYFYYKMAIKACKLRKHHISRSLYQKALSYEGLLFGSKVLKKGLKLGLVSHAWLALNLPKKIEKQDSFYMLEGLFGLFKELPQIKQITIQRGIKIAKNSGDFLKLCDFCGNKIELLERAFELYMNKSGFSLNYEMSKIIKKMIKLDKNRAYEMLNLSFKLDFDGVFGGAEDLLEILICDFDELDLAEKIAKKISKNKNVYFLSTLTHIFGKSLWIKRMVLNRALKAEYEELVEATEILANDFLDFNAAKSLCQMIVELLKEHKNHKELDCTLNLIYKIAPEFLEQACINVFENLDKDSFVQYGVLAENFLRCKQENMGLECLKLKRDKCVSFENILHTAQDALWYLDNRKLAIELLLGGRDLPDIGNKSDIFNDRYFW